MNRYVRRLVTLLIVPFMLLGGALGTGAAQDGNAGSDNPFADLGLPEIAVTLTEDAIEGAPTELTAGRHLLSVTNTIPAPDLTLGPPVSGLLFVQVPAGQAAADFMTQMTAPPPDQGEDAASPAAGPMAPPPWYYETVLSGGLYVMPDQTAHAVIELTAGDWIAWGRATTAMPAPVVVTVTGEAPPDQPTPEATVRVDMTEYSFIASPDLTTGPQIIEVVNIGAQPHFLSVTGVPAGTTVDDVMGLLFGMAPGAAAPAGDLSFDDLVPAFDTIDQSRGVTAWYAADLAPGTYLLACYVPEPESGVPHAMLGMAQIIEIE